MRRWKELRQPKDAKHGMCMAAAFFRQPGGDDLYLAVGYEDGTLSVWDVAQPDQAMMSARLHAEPIMALAIDALGGGNTPQTSVSLNPTRCWQTGTTESCSECSYMIYGAVYGIESLVWTGPGFVC